MFPFQWRIKGFDDEIFSEQISLKNINYSLDSNWERCIVPTESNEKDDLYNERNYFYEFVHDALYDNGQENSLVRHFERIETKHSDVFYVISTKEKTYELQVEAINLNLYSTGVGVLSFYIQNNKYTDPADVLKINQVGRRVFPPFIGSKNIGIIADSIEINGLNGRCNGYKEDFSCYTNATPANSPALFIVEMIKEVAENIILKPVIDDRMFVQCWYKNDDWANEFCGEKYNEFLNSSKWYEFVYVDDLNGISCQNEDMQKELIKKATYERWQKRRSLYGITRYSMMYLTEVECPTYLLNYFETIYARMAELILVQKASVLRFSAEVTNLSNLDEKSGFSEKVSSLYKEYIRFVNQIHFREVSAQDQGIELYQKLYETMNLGKHVDKLDEEIGELYNYVVLHEDHKSSNTMSLLTWIATIAVPMTVMAGIFGMNNDLLSGSCEGEPPLIYSFGWQFGLLLGISALIIICILIIRNRRLK